MLRIDRRRFGDHSEFLVGEFLDVLRCTWPDKVELEILLDLGGFCAAV